ncbi:Rgp1-domain-containing protein [Piedraia hortae CBS 480.64]|uniref:Rgp1-domain-containing protein n=1 Tax=Piedraia hortae CBS 480.64 TaxID=1314780 RepID=A0A6A7BSX7_9PEZI|nr:Rgp1-domain-containing protein [Piedraia hortae CBS 480.64]
MGGRRWVMDSTEDAQARVLAKIDAMDGQGGGQTIGKRKRIDDKAKEGFSATKEASTQSRPGKTTLQKQHKETPRKEPWQIHKAELQAKLGKGVAWEPRRRLSPDALEGIRALHATDPDTFTYETLAKHFKISYEAVRRIVKSKWRPSADEAEDRRERWERRGVRKWRDMAQKGMKPPRNDQEGRAQMSPSNVRVDVRWDSLAVYSGEEIECLITFVNAAESRPDEGVEGVKTPSTLPLTDASSRPASAAPGLGPPPVSWRTQRVHHRPTLSLDIAGGKPSVRTAPQPSTPLNAHKGHGRSLSIMSLGSDVVANQLVEPPPTKSTPGHSRSLSLQVVPGRPTNETKRQPSPLSFEFPARQKLGSHKPLPLQRGLRPEQNPNPVSRVLSECETPRTSSEYEFRSTVTASKFSVDEHFLPESSPVVAGSPETLILAYAQTAGYFTLESSIVNDAQFEKIKYSVLQSEGGVAAADRRSRQASSGFFGSAWGSITSILGGGEDKSSSLAQQVKANVDSKRIPLLSTPQSLLFVDLTLLPGEKRQFSYRFKLPGGLPASHNGRVMKICYHLTVGVQKDGNNEVKNFEIPFRVLGGYTRQGQARVWDLMKPKVILKDEAAISSSPCERKPMKSRQNMEDFLRYTERLLSKGDAAPVMTEEATEEKTTAALINDICLHSAFQLEKKFQIAISGNRICSISLLRTNWKVGEVITGVVNFSDSSSSYSVTIDLFTEEVLLATSLARRSEASISRFSRKVLANSHKLVLFSERVAFSLPVPLSATPSLSTSAVEVKYGIKFTFIVINEDTWERCGENEFGRAYTGREALKADSVDITLPIKVYGSTGVGIGGGITGGAV